MPRVAAWAIEPEVVASYAGFSRAGLRSLQRADIIPALSQLRAVDAVIARVCRYVFWVGPSATAPGASRERQGQQQIAAEAAAQLRKLLAGRDCPLRLAVCFEDGSVHPIDDFGDPTNLVFGKDALSGVWVSVPLQEWWKEATALPHGGEGGETGTK